MDDSTPLSRHVIVIAVFTVIGCAASVLITVLLAFYSSPSMSIVSAVAPGQWADEYLDTDQSLNRYTHESSASIGYRMEMLMLSDSDVYGAFGSTSTSVAVRVFAGWPLQSMRGESFYGDYPSDVNDPGTLIDIYNLRLDILSPRNPDFPTQIIPLPFLLNMLVFSALCNLLFCRGRWIKVAAVLRSRG